MELGRLGSEEGACWTRSHRNDTFPWAFLQTDGTLCGCRLLHMERAGWLRRDSPFRCELSRFEPASVVCWLQELARL